MASFELFKSKFRKSIAESIYNEITTKSARYYHFLGKENTWSDFLSPYIPSSPTDTPGAPQDNFRYDLHVRRDILSTKLIKSSDVSFVIPRYDWTSGTIYDMYDDAITPTDPAYSGATRLEDAKFYVLAITGSDYNVYKCISNNYNAASTVKPTGTSTSVFTTADGYIWKFMYTIPTSLRTKFLTATYIPVSTALKARFYTSGKIISVIIANGGNGYGSVGYISPSGTITCSTSTKTVAGSGTSFLTDAVVGYKIKRRSDGAVIGTVASIASNTSLTLVNNSAITLSTGTSFNVYVAPQITGDGSGADLDLVISAIGEVTGVIVNAGGTGYNSVEIKVNPWTVASGRWNSTYNVVADLKADLSVGDVTTNQATVEQAAVEGSIEVIKVTNGGSGYNSTTIEILGDGTGAVATATIVNKRITKINMTNVGTGYTWTQINIKDPSASGVGAEARAIMSPLNGHGFDAVDELNSRTILFYSSVARDQNQGIDVTNDYRKVGLLKNITEFQSTNRFESDTGSGCVLITGTFNATYFPQDKLLVNSSGTNATDSNGEYYKKYRIVDTNTSTNSILLSVFNNFTISAGDILIDPDDPTNNNKKITVTSVKERTIDQFSGELLFISVRDKFKKNSDQFITVRTAITV